MGVLVTCLNSSIDRFVLNAVPHERAKGKLMIDHDNLEEFRDPQTYDLVCDEVDEELRAERTQRLLKRYAGVIVAAALLIGVFKLCQKGLPILYC